MEKQKKVHTNEKPFFHVYALSSQFSTKLVYKEYDLMSRHQYHNDRKCFVSLDSSPINNRYMLLVNSIIDDLPAPTLMQITLFKVMTQIEFDSEVRSSAQIFSENVAKGI